MKKIVALLLAIVMALGLCTTAMAAEVTGSITINDAAHVSVANKTFNAYKVLDAKMVDTNDIGKGIAYTVPAQLADFYATRYSLSKESPTFDEDVAAAIAQQEQDNMFAFAAAVLAAAKEKGIAPVSKTAGDVTSVTIDNLPLGYYVIEDAGTNTPISALMLDTTTPDAQITLKADKPSIDKKIDGDNDTDPSTQGKVPMNNAAIGDKVPYIVTSRVPDMRGYEKYFFVVNDTLSKGLKFNNDVTITIGGQVIDPSQYTVTSTGGQEGQETQVKIVFKNFIQYKTQANAEIVIKYSATVDTDAVIGTQGNPNKVNLDFSHNPNIVPEGVDEPTPGDKEHGVIGTTPDSVTRTFVTALEITKTDEDGKRLTGAEFELVGTRLNTVLVKKDVFTQSPEGTWYKLNDGTYTETAPSGNEDQYASTEVKYTRETKLETITKKEDVHYKGVVGDDGILRFEGLAAGDYIITELKAPDGYNLIKKPIQITITCKLPDSVDGQCAWAVTEPATSNNELIQLTIVNKTGTELPSTGGMGTTLFYTVGALLVIGAAVLFITKKRVSRGQ